MPWSVLDISSITDNLIALLNAEVAMASPVWTTPPGIDFFQIDVSGAMPQAVREGEIPDTILSLYLLHVSQEPFYRSTSTISSRGQLNPSQPLSLNLYYLLSAYAGTKYNHEQIAMSIAMRCFHENTIVKKPKHLPDTLDDEEYTISMEVQNADEMSRLWQALSTPLRMAVIYKVSIVFVTPSAKPVPPLGPPPTAVALAVSPMSGAGLTPARLFSATSRDSFFVPPDASGLDAMASISVTGLVCAGDTLIVTGAGLDDPDYAHVYLGATEVTAKRSPGLTPNDFLLVIDKTTPPGVYDLTVGRDVPSVLRSGKIAITVAARVDVLSRPLELVPDVNGIYTVTGAGFTPASLQVLFGATALTKVGGPPNAGEFAVDGAGTTITFKQPAAPASGRNYIGIRVNGIDTPPSWYVTVP